MRGKQTNSQTLGKQKQDFDLVCGLKIKTILKRVKTAQTNYILELKIEFILKLCFEKTLYFPYVQNVIRFSHGKLSLSKDILKFFISHSI